MQKFYRNVLGKAINVELFGVGKVSIPAEAESVPLEHYVAEAIMAMTPEKILEENTNPVVDPDAVLHTDEDLEDEEDEESAAPSPFQEMTLEELRAYCEEHGIEYSKSTNRATLIKKLINL